MAVFAETPHYKSHNKSQEDTTIQQTRIGDNNGMLRPLFVALGCLVFGRMSLLLELLLETNLKVAVTI